MESRNRIFSFKLAICVIGSIVLGACGSEVTNEKSKPPNIILIYADDLGYTDLGVYHDYLVEKGYLAGDNFYLTPNIDRLAQNGVMFTDGYANAPNCMPSRAALLSGQYAPRTNMYNVGNSEKGFAAHRGFIPPVNVTELAGETATFGEALTEHGYNAVHFGKWHTGYKEKTQPVAQGFEAKWASGKYKGRFMSETIFRASHWAHFHYGPEMAEPGYPLFKDGAFHMIFGDIADPRNNPNKEQQYKVTADSLMKKGAYLSNYMGKQVGKMMVDLASQNNPFFLHFNPYLVQSYKCP